VFIHKTQNKLFNPEVHAMILQDFKNTKQETTSKFLGGGGSFTMKGLKPPKTTYNVGGGTSYYYKKNIYFTVNYDLSLRNKFIGHSGSLLVKWIV
jgi:hypothetical protein